DLALQRARAVDLEAEAGVLRERTTEGFGVALVGVAAPVPQHDLVRRRLGVADAHGIGGEARDGAEREEIAAIEPACLEVAGAVGQQLPEECPVLHRTSSCFPGLGGPALVTSQPSTITAASSGQWSQTTWPVLPRDSLRHAGAWTVSSPAPSASTRSSR